MPTSGPYTFTYTTVPSDALVIGGGIGPIRRQNDTLAIRDLLGETNTCHLTIGDHEGSTAPEPPIATSVTLDSLGRRIFAGTVVTTKQEYEATRPTHLKWHVDLVDPTWQLNRLIPFGTYTAVSVTAIVLDLIALYAPGFTTVHVEAGLLMVTITFDGSLNFAGCLDALKALVGGGCAWNVDYTNDLHFGITPETDEVPDPLVDGSPTLAVEPPVRYGRDLSQVRTRVFVRGTGCFATIDDLGAQGELAAVMGGDGVIEAPVINRSELITNADCTAYGTAVLAVWSRVITQIEFDTFDPKVVSGKTITAALTNPPIVGDFLIQSVTLSEIGEHVTTPPRRSVIASSVRFTLEDLLSTLTPAVANIAGNAGTASALQNAVLIHGESFDGAANIDLSAELVGQSGLRILQ